MSDGLHIAELSIGTHFFSINPLNSQNVLNSVYAFSTRLIEYEWKWDPMLRKNVKVIGRVWSGRVGTTQFRYPISLLEDFLGFLDRRGIPKSKLKIIQLPLYTPAKADFKLAPEYVLRDYQEEGIQFSLDLKSKDVHSSLLMMPTGSGKAQPLDSLIRTPDGWARMGEMYVGRDIIAADGSVTKVTGVYPQGIKPRYRITFSDFRTVDCCDEHLWKVYVEHRRDLKWRVVTTKELIRLKGLNTTRCFVPLYEPKEGIKRDLPIDPYVLGLLLGNGGMSQRAIRYSTMDPCRVKVINEYFNTLGIELIKKSEWDYSFRKVKDYAGDNFVGITNRLKSLGLQGKLSYQKEIPAEYMEGSLSQRLALVQGLMDSDGTAEKHGSISYSSSSISLALSFQHLIHSLGGIAKISKKTPTYTYKGEKLSGRINYNIQIRYKNPKELFQLPRKRDRLPEENQYSKGLKLRIDKIELVGASEMQCISVDHPEHLYITDEFVVTHNTVTLLGFASRLGLRMGMFVAPAHFDSWVKYFKQYLNIPEERVYEVRGGKSIRKLFALAETDEFNYDATLFSLRTLSDFFTAYEEDPQACIDLYGGTPFEMWCAAKIGFLGGDEVHENLFAVHWLHTFIHGPFHLGLSATMLHKDKEVEARQQEIYPMVRRFDNIPLPKHTRLVNIGYRFENLHKDKIQLTFPRRTTYAQAAFEGSILKNRKVKDRFLKMIKFCLDNYHLNRKKPGERCALYFYRIDVLKEVVEYLRKEYPSLDIRRYAEDDPLDNIMEPDIAVTTVGSAGTGTDIPKLVTVISFVNQDSQQKNIQLLGRLREPRPGESEKLFIQLYGANVPKHQEYKANRDYLFIKRIASRAETYYSIDL